LSFCAAFCKYFSVNDWNVNAGFGLDRRLVTVDDESSPYGKAQVTVDWGGDVTFGESERALFCEINENFDIGNYRNGHWNFKTNC
jgi:hypothetical protein